MTIQVLISCMYEKDRSIVQRSKVQSDCIVVNQCDTDSIEEFSFLNDTGQICKVLFINTTERGLSKSRNLAIRNSWADICLVCDYDEILTSGYVNAIEKAYITRPESDVIAFAISCDQYTRTYSKTSKKLRIKEILKTSSQQITFKRNSIEGKRIFFDEKMGSGTGNGPGEETMFLLTCKKNGLALFYNPFCVATICKGDSKWFNGYTEKFFQNQGWTDRRLLGPILGFIYILYWSIFRRAEYKKDGLSVYSALKNSLVGYFSKR